MQPPALEWRAEPVDGEVDPDGHRIDRDRRPVPQKYGAALPADNPGATEGALSGRAVYLSQCHGWIWYDSLDGFSTQRGNVFDTVEDFHNPEGMNQILTAYLENAGAHVYTVKERDTNPLLAYADNDGDGYSESGSGFADGARGFGDMGTWAYGENPFESGTTRTFPGDGGGVATWRPEVPADGYYAVYVSWDASASNAHDAHYRLTHPGGTIDRHYDQTTHGSTWQYVDNLWLTAGESLGVELIGDGGSGSLSADAVRIGGGTGVIERVGELTGRPRWEEGAILATQFNGAPEEVYDPYGDGNGSDPSSRSVWAAWEHPAGEEAVYVSWHSNAFDGGARGTGVYTYDAGCTSGAPVDGSVDLAELLQEEIVAVGTFWDSDWEDRGTKTDCFSEVNPSLNPEMPAALIELAFHDNALDVAYLKDPAFRRDASRAMYRAIVRYFDAGAFSPEPPVAVQLVHGSDGRLVASWSAGPVGDLWGDAATSWVVYQSKDGRSWDSGTDAASTSYTLESDPGELVFVRIAARNSGGLSFPSEIMGGRRSADGTAPVLVVAAFDRLDAGLLDWEDISLSGVGDVVRMDMRRMNAADIVVPFGEAIAWPFDSAADEANVALDGYRAVVWATGEESTVDESFSEAQQATVRAYVAAGGTLWASGAEMLWDLDYRGSDDDRAFASEVLGATMESDDADTTEATGEGILAGLDLTFGEVYPVEWPDVLASDHDVIARYSTGGAAAVIGGGVATFGFPFDTVGPLSVRTEVAQRVLAALVPEYVPPDPGDTGNGDTGNDETGAEETGTEDTGPGFNPRPRFPRAKQGEPGGCGCGTGGPGAEGGLATALIAALATIRRRRGSGSQGSPG